MGMDWGSGGGDSWLDMNSGDSLYGYVFSSMSMPFYTWRFAATAPATPHALSLCPLPACPPTYFPPTYPFPTTIPACHLPAVPSSYHPTYLPFACSHTHCLHTHPHPCLLLSFITTPPPPPPPAITYHVCLPCNTPIKPCHLPLPHGSLHSMHTVPPLPLSVSSLSSPAAPTTWPPLHTLLPHNNLPQQQHTFLLLLYAIFPTIHVYLPLCHYLPHLPPPPPACVGSGEPGGGQGGVWWSGWVGGCACSSLSPCLPTFSCLPFICLHYCLPSACRHYHLFPLRTPFFSPCPSHHHGTSYCHFALCLPTSPTLPPAAMPGLTCCPLNFYPICSLPFYFVRPWPYLL